MFTRFINDIKLELIKELYSFYKTFILYANGGKVNDIYLTIKAENNAIVYNDNN